MKRIIISCILILFTIILSDCRGFAQTPSWTTTPPYQMPAGTRMKVEYFNAIHQSLYNDAVNAATQSIFPTGGTVGQVLTKASANDFDLEWSDASSSSTSSAFEWEIGYPSHKWKFNASYGDNSDFDLHLRYASDTLDTFKFNIDGTLYIVGLGNYPSLRLDYDAASDGNTDTYSFFTHEENSSYLGRSDTDKYLDIYGGASSSFIRFHGSAHATRPDYIDLYFGSSTRALTIGATGEIFLKTGTGVSEFSTDSDLSDESDNAVPTEKAVKDYVDNTVADLLPPGTDGQIPRNNGESWEATSSIYVGDGGNIGIGTDTPGETLEVVGNTRIQGDVQIHDGTGSADDVFLRQYPDNSLSIFAGGVQVLNISATYLRMNNSGGYADLKKEVTSLTNPVFCPVGDDADTGIGGDSTNNTLSLIAGGKSIIEVKEDVVTIKEGPLKMSDISEPSAPSGGAYIYASGGEMIVMDSSGNTTEISPHCDKTGEWTYMSGNTYTGRVVSIRMEDFVRDYDKRFGTSFYKETWVKPKALPKKIPAWMKNHREQNPYLKRD